MPYGKTITLEVDHEQAVTRVKEAFQSEGFGTLTEIDVQATLREKLGEDMEPYVILGTCNPHLAHRALEVEAEIGLLLPCNVVVRGDGHHSVVHALDPRIIAEVPANPALAPIAEEAGRRIDAALAALTA